MGYCIQLKLFANLAQISSKDSGCVQIQPGTTVRDLMDAVGIHPREVKLIFINGIAKQTDSELHNGDRVGLFPPVGGG